MKRRDVAHGMALAALDGAWEPAAIAERITSALGIANGPWTRGLGRELCAALAAPDELERVRDAILSARSFRVLWKQGELRVREWRTPLPLPNEPRFGAPPIATIADLAALLDVPLEHVDWLADARGMNQRARDPRLVHYTYRWIEKRSGGARLIEAPKAVLKAAQRRMLDRVLASVPPHHAAHGFVAGRSVIDHARAHAKRAIVARLDLKSFFWSIAPSRVRGIFTMSGYSRAVSAALMGLATTKTPHAVLSAMPRSAEDRFELRRALANRHVPQGAPTSGAIANLACFALDRRLSGLAARFGATYTRYADDLAFSGDRTFAREIDRFLPRASAVVIEEGFAIQHRKTRVMRASTRQELCGVVVNEGTNLRRADVELLEAILVNCLRHGPESQNRDGHPEFRAHLAGRVAWVTALAPQKGAYLRELFEGIEWQ